MIAAPQREKDRSRAWRGKSQLYREDRFQGEERGQAKRASLAEGGESQHSFDRKVYHVTYCSHKGIALTSNLT